MSFRGRSRARFGFRGMASSSGSSHQQQREQSEIGQPKQEEIRSQISELSIQERSGLTTHELRSTRRPSVSSREQKDQSSSRRDDEDPSSYGERSAGRGNSDRGSGRGGLSGGPGGDRMAPKSFSSYPETQEYPIVMPNEVERGVKGRKIELLANYMRVNVQPTIVYQYNIDFNFKDEDERRRRTKVGKMVYIVTQKGHQTRFALTQPTGPSDRPLHNVPSGTVVDHTIIDPTYCMFFINSHFSPLGTSRPLKYVVLHNDYERRQMSMDDLQKICFYLCHNCTRYRGGPIAMPIPVRYADLCAYRSKMHLEAQHASKHIPAENQEEFERHVISKLNKLVKLNDNIKNSLFYC
uniref:Uncharacterized protein LOC113794345 n=1 Tax=Dermatophagoides pteronyssinus TaxID=6956 RepID=A0A6P6Y6W2_DERPT|nr:uncharacterized protein LOC113794345 [Dermatophagoides pteronyssinus]